MGILKKIRFWVEVRGCLGLLCSTFSSSAPRFLAKRFQVYALSSRKKGGVMRAPKEVLHKFQFFVELLYDEVCGSKSKSNISPWGSPLDSSSAQLPGPACPIHGSSAAQVCRATRPPLRPTAAITWFLVWTTSGHRDIAVRPLNPVVPSPR